MRSRPTICAVTPYCLKLRARQAYLGDLPSGATPKRYFVRPPWRSLYSASFETMLVRIEASDGTVGWGEALAPVAPEVLVAIVELLLGPQLIGEDPRKVRALSAKLSNLMRERGHLAGHQADAVAACDIALWDLAGRLHECSVVELLGGGFRTTIPTYVSGLPGQTDEERAGLAKDWASKGVGRVKLALGYGVDADLATVDAVLAAAPRLHVAVDAHWAYDLADALRLGKGLDRRGSWFLEAPLAPEDIEGHAELAASLETPVAVGEALRNRYEFKAWLAHRAADVVQPDVARTGISEATAIASLADSHHVSVAPHHSVGLGISLAAGLHLAAAVENLAIFEYQPSTLPVANEILTQPLRGGPGSFDLPPGPGLGVEVDEKKVLELAGATT